MEPSSSRKTGAPAVAETAWGQDLIGETFDDFHVSRQLGEGGMGRVYLAEQLSLKRKVAIKVLRQEIAETPTSLARFRAESKTIAQLSHANVVQAYMVGEHKGRHYLVLEYVDGISLRRYLTKRGPLEPALALSIMRQVASALQRAAELEIVHRDIKPENILITRKAEAKVADFGLSRCLTLDEPLDLTRSGAAVGTPRYMSPEQIEGKPVDQRTDIYSFGVMCYEMLAGRPPFDGATAFEIALKHVREEPVPLQNVRAGVPAPLCAIVHKMMAKKPDDRYASARALLKDIAKARESLGAQTASIQALSVQADSVHANSVQTAAAHTAAVKAAGDTPREDVESASVEEVSSESVPVVKRAWPRWALPAGAAAAALLLIGVTIALLFRGNASDTPDKGTLVEDRKDEGAKKEREDAKKEREDALKKERDLKLAVDQILKDGTPNPSGIEACLDLGVLYLEQSKLAEADTLFTRMSERRPPSAYHFLGRLGLAVTDAVKNDDKASQAKFKELFDPKKDDHRARTINEYLKKNPGFEEWVNEADARGVRFAVAGAPSRSPPPISLFSKFKIRRP